MPQGIQAKEVMRVLSSKLFSESHFGSWIAKKLHQASYAGMQMTVDAKLIMKKEMRTYPTRMISSLR